jgi:hypothetical protein
MGFRLSNLRTIDLSPSVEVWPTHLLAADDRRCLGSVSAKGSIGVSVGGLGDEVNRLVYASVCESRACDTGVVYVNKARFQPGR